METFVVYTEWEAERPISPETLATIRRHLRPDDEELCTWLDETATRLNLSFDLDELTYEGAARVAVRFAHEAAELGPLSGRLIDVTVCTDDAQARFTDSIVELMS